MIALGVRISKQKGEHHLIKKEPQPLREFRPANFDADYQKRFDEMASSDEESEDSDRPAKSRKAAAGDDDDWNSVSDDRQTQRTKKRKEEKHAHYMKKFGDKIAASKEAKLIEMEAPEAAENQDDSDSDKIDDEEQGGEWVTADNLHKHLSHGVSLPAV